MLEISKWTIPWITVQGYVWLKNCEIEKIAIQALEEHIKSLEEDCSRITCEADVAINRLKNKKQEFHISLYHSWYIAKKSWSEVKHLETNAKILKKERIEVKREELKC